ncbi:MAG: phosphopantothenoylcysteine decarboxylase [Clostridiales Family XIII bacterium]|jgi:phosphopantothenoylcysteine decarboxylase/phosphopantothenoylcysteine decarboxylase/phosphopantothenate--cysteine ligase|nr:phosphopantothenoylcysteine decarboxylase [Clostridiales Family XIII bacterium]
MADILLGVTGSIAAYKAADLANSLCKSGHTVHVVMTRNATRFIAPLTFRTLTKRPVYTDSFDEAQPFDVEHIGLAKLADVLVIAPASANIIGKLAAGIADDLLSTVAMAAWRKPALLCPAMNTAMYESPSVTANLETLQARGMGIVEPRESLLACGDLGKGALAETERILAAVEGLLAAGLVGQGVKA